MLAEKIFNDYKEAMKARDTLKSSVLSFLRADMLNQATAMKKDKLLDAEVIVVIKKQIKQRQDSIQQFTSGGRREAAEKEKKESEILKSYLPAELSAEQIKSLMEEAIISTGAKDIKDMGRLMKELTVKLAGKADGRLVSDLVRQRLSSPS
ncbi:MAG: GatB/YqeY domain-containing protein [Candidatus Omnitrophica bacterium]|nr:GatB/YqeY domain-containing protein [Candidatus Omnitrophota bacterium]MBU4303331.1 GatB/YqeY domain-containing protein [Candidatus Omnitrophota bacterium]MBU4418267.1 GatB/YqeY domain-containing protein [Candidatus Omnitrophota bacterium]MBU4468342.1 GatB/YqeY domain-containing protein [Candidatus Omnitrophota bacterium]MCG2708016.1 GatB/YqeY domain-containing protein [Candidatus Omnitrophota bacterium]